MAKNSRGKRPCSICRKWFAPDVRQKGRQTTCSQACQNERHRRQCENWNRKNKAVSKNNYLAKKLESAVAEQAPAGTLPISLQRQAEPVLPLEVIVTTYGIEPAIIIRYMMTQIINHTNGRIRGFP